MGKYRRSFTTVRGHPRSYSNGQVLSHVLVVEQALGRHFSGRRPVHHVNGDATDNRPSNLVLCESQGYHMLLERRTRAYDACGHADRRICCFCGEWDKPENLYIGAKEGVRSGDNVWHRECRNAYLRRYRRRVLPPQLELQL
jgi:hypothetical protein